MSKIRCYIYNPVLHIYNQLQGDNLISRAQDDTGTTAAILCPSSRGTGVGVVEIVGSIIPLDKGERLLPPLNSCSHGATSASLSVRTSITAPFVSKQQFNNDRPAIFRAAWTYGVPSEVKRHPVVPLIGSDGWVGFGEFSCITLPSRPGDK